MYLEYAPYHSIIYRMSREKENIGNMIYKPKDLYFAGKVYLFGSKIFDWIL